MIKVMRIFTVLALWAGACSGISHAQLSFDVWLDVLRQDAAQSGISQKTINETLSSPRLLDSVIKADRNQPEFKKNLATYLTGVLSKSRVVEGRRKLRQHNRLLQQIYRQYGVQPRFIVALWGIETFYGTYTGKMPIIDSLVTLAYDGRRGPYFRAELINALKIIDAGHVSYTDMKGSWAGAMGQVQFMPSSFLKFAVDGNGDGVIDLWEKPEDYLSSAANYLAGVGWQKNLIWGREVLAPKGLAPELIDMKKTALLATWHKYGVRKIDGTHLPKADVRGSLVQPEGAGGRTFLVYDNYRALMKWNRAHSFAIAVGMLADRLRQ